MMTNFQREVMNKRQLSRLKKLNKEAELLKEKIQDFKPMPKDFVADTAKDYKTGYPRTITIEGIGDDEYIKRKNRLYNVYVRKRKEILKEIEVVEAFISTVEDSEMRTILRLHYIDGLTQEEIAAKLDYSRSAVAMKLKRFFMKE